MYTDKFGNELKVGDPVIHVDGNRYVNISKCHVHKFTPKMIKIVERVGETDFYSTVTSSRLVKVPYHI